MKVIVRAYIFILIPILTCLPAYGMELAETSEPESACRLFINAMNAGIAADAYGDHQRYKTLIEDKELDNFLKHNVIENDRKFIINEAQVENITQNMPHKNRLADIKKKVTNFFFKENHQQLCPELLIAVKKFNDTRYFYKANECNKNDTIHFLDLLKEQVPVAGDAIVALKSQLEKQQWIFGIDPVIKKITDICQFAPFDAAHTKLVSAMQLLKTETDPTVVQNAKKEINDDIDAMIFSIYKTITVSELLQPLNRLGVLLNLKRNINAAGTYLSEQVDKWLPVIQQVYGVTQMCINSPALASATVEEAQKDEAVRKSLIATIPALAAIVNEQESKKNAPVPSSSPQQLKTDVAPAAVKNEFERVTAYSKIISALDAYSNALGTDEKKAFPNISETLNGIMNSTILKSSIIDGINAKIHDKIPSLHHTLLHQVSAEQVIELKYSIYEGFVTLLCDEILNEKLNSVFKIGNRLNELLVVFASSEKYYPALDSLIKEIESFRKLVMAQGWDDDIHAQGEQLYGQVQTIITNIKASFQPKPVSSEPVEKTTRGSLLDLKLSGSTKIPKPVPASQALFQSPQLPSGASAAATTPQQSTLPQQLTSQKQFAAAAGNQQSGAPATPSEVLPEQLKATSWWSFNWFMPKQWATNLYNSMYNLYKSIFG